MFVGLKKPFPFIKFIPNSDMTLLDTEEQKEEWRRDPEKYREYRKMIEDELNRRFRFALRNSKESDESNAVSAKPGLCL